MKTNKTCSRESIFGGATPILTKIDDISKKLTHEWCQTLAKTGHENYEPRCLTFLYPFVLLFLSFYYFLCTYKATFILCTCLVYSADSKNVCQRVREKISPTKSHFCTFHALALIFAVSLSRKVAARMRERATVEKESERNENETLRFCRSERLFRRSFDKLSVTLTRFLTLF
uniref:(northern house mosquito) hypothetical protein n=1 Tax=Culex pipiens TaxID=7175 RepID=A0A8D8GED6_CULPI